MSSTATRHLPAPGLAALLGGWGVLHLVRPGIYRPLIPRALGRPDPWVRWSGYAELACAAALVAPPTRRVGGWASAALLVAVFPGNVTFAVRSRPDARSWVGRPGPAWARLPLQVPLVAWAVGVARNA